MSITKRENGSYEVCMDMGKDYKGKRARKYATCRTKREAQKIESQFKVERERSNGVVANVSLEEFITEIFIPEKKPLVARTTWHGYETPIRLRIIPILGNVFVCDLKKIHVQRLINECQTYSVAKKAYDMLKNILGVAVDYELIDHNPCNGKVRFPRRSEPKNSQHNGVWLSTFEEHRPILEALKDTWLEPVVLLGLTMGLRKGEILGLDWSTVHFGDDALKSYVSIRQSYTFADGKNTLGVPKTPESMRDVPMMAYTFERLKIIRDKLGLIDANTPVCVFSGHRALPATTQRKLKRFLAENDLPAISTSSMRHSFATSCLQAGMDISVVSKLLGHTTITTTYNNYIKIQKKDLSRDVQTMNDKLDMTEMSVNVGGENKKARSRA